MKDGKSQQRVEKQYRNHAVSGRVKRGDRRTITESPSWR